MRGFGTSRGPDKPYEGTGKNALRYTQNAIGYTQAEKLKIDAWKGYTGQGLGRNPEGWWLDDEQVAYPTLELSRKLKVKNICVHKGLASGIFNEEHCHPRDVVKVSRDFPDLNFLVYHSGFKGIQDALPAAESGFRKSAYVPWVSDLCQWRKQNPHMTNVYMELGSTFGSMAITHPLLCCHVLGMIRESAIAWKVRANICTSAGPPTGTGLSKSPACKDLAQWSGGPSGARQAGPT